MKNIRDTLVRYYDEDVRVDPMFWQAERKKGFDVFIIDYLGRPLFFCTLWTVLYLKVRSKKREWLQEESREIRVGGAI